MERRALLNTEANERRLDSGCGVETATTQCVIRPAPTRDTQSKFSKMWYTCARTAFIVSILIVPSVGYANHQDWIPVQGWYSQYQAFVYAPYQRPPAELHISLPYASLDERHVTYFNATTHETFRYFPFRNGFSREGGGPVPMQVRTLLQDAWEDYQTP
jgi:hypothetical protein